MIVKRIRVCTGFSLIELLVGLAISSVLLSLVVRVYDANHRLFLTNKALADVSYDGQFIISLLNSNIALAGNTNVYSDKLNTLVDVNEEADFITGNPIATELNFPLFPLITSTEGGELSDTIVINSIGSRSCTGTNFDFNDGELFHVVNQYYVDGSTLRCKSYDGRYLRGVKTNASANYSVSLLENVYDFQVQYGVIIKNDTAIKDVSTNNSNLNQEFIWVNADDLTNLLIREADTETITNKVKIRAVNIELLLGVKTVAILSKQTSINLSGGSTFSVPDNVLIRKFATIIVFKVS
jgi:type IV pilus assembly protein PilW